MTKKHNVENLTPTQIKVKHPRPVRYAGKKAVDPCMARQIITLYLTCGLGYSPIREVIGLKSDRLVEDVIRQHMLGRGGVDGEGGELTCPPINPLTPTTALLIKLIAQERGTIHSDYVERMLREGRWWDEPVTSKVTKCSCGYVIEDKKFNHCPMCGKEISKPVKTGHNRLKSVTLFKTDGDQISLFDRDKEAQV